MPTNRLPSNSKNKDLQYFKDLALRDDLLAMASVASVLLIDNLTFTTALVAWLLNLLNHRTHLTKGNLDTLTITVSAGLNSTFFTTTALALCTNDMLLESQLGSLAHVKVFQADLETVSNILTTAWARRLAAAAAASKHTATKQLREQVLSIQTTSHTGLAIQSLLAI
jgi:hypothetical protein